MKNVNRTTSFKKNEEVEKLLGLLDKYLSNVEDELTNTISSSIHPPIFVFGCARSGTTVLHQYLINNIKSIYPSNFISRFFYAPYLGGIFYKLFTQLDTKGELLGNYNNSSIESTYTSDLGKTKGILSPNEFWYFWRKHFPINIKGTIDVDKINKSEAIRFRNRIYAIQNLFEGPFISKGMIANNCIDYLSELFPNAIFVYIKRNLYSNSKSLYKARKDFFGTTDEWYSFYPKEPLFYENLSSEEQVVLQVIDTNHEIESSLANIHNGRVVKLEYESFCENPKIILQKLNSLDSSIIISDNSEPTKFSFSDKDSNETIKSIIKTINIKK